MQKSSHVITHRTLLSFYFAPVHVIYLVPYIHPSVICRHSCCVLVPPSGISRLPLAFPLHFSFPPPLVSFPPDLTLCALSVTVYLCYPLSQCVTGRPAELIGLTEHNDGNRNRASQHDLLQHPHSELNILYYTVSTGGKCSLQSCFS